MENNSQASLFSDASYDDVSLDVECARKVEDWDELFEIEEISTMMNKCLAM